MICILSIGIISLVFLILTFISNWKDRIKEVIQDNLKKLENAIFLGKADVLIPREAVAFKKSELLDQAKHYIKILGVTGLFSLEPSTRELLIKKSTINNTKIQILLLHPNSPILDHFAKHEGELTISPSVVGRKSQDVPETRKALKNDILRTLKGFREVAESKSCLISDIAEIRLYDLYPFWRGIIVDGNKTGYAIVHFPRDGTEAPFLENDNVKIVKHFEKYYFDKIWEDSKPVQEVV